jgi:hypothetical protein
LQFLSQFDPAPSRQFDMVIAKPEVLMPQVEITALHVKSWPQQK